MISAFRGPLCDSLRPLYLYVGCFFLRFGAATGGGRLSAVR